MIFVIAYLVFSYLFMYGVKTESTGLWSLTVWLAPITFIIFLGQLAGKYANKLIENDL